MTAQKKGTKHSQHARRVELRRPHPAPVRREALPKAVRLRLRDAAPRRPIRARRAVRPDRLAELLRAARLRASRGGVEGHLVRGREVDLLHDVDLAALRPVRALSPEPGPDGAPVGEVHGVEDEERADGEVVVRRDPDLSGGRVSNEARA